MASALSKSKPPPARTPEREALRARIEEATAAAARRQALERALATAECSVLEANARVVEAEADVETARADAARHLVEVAAGNPTDPPRTTRAARDALQDAVDARDAAREARDELRRQQPADGDGEIRRMALREAAAAVLRAELQTRGDETAAAIAAQFHALVERAEWVRQLAEHAGLFPQARNSLNQLVDVIGSIGRLAQADIMPDQATARAAGAAKFQAMMDALMTDADAPLPE